MYLPINRRGDLLLRSELQGVDDAQQLVKVPSCGRRVEDGQLQLLVRANHKHLRWDRSTCLRQRATQALGTATGTQWPWAVLHSEPWAVFHPYPAHRGPACPAGQTTASYHRQWWGRAEDFQVQRSTPSHPRKRRSTFTSGSRWVTGQSWWWNTWQETTTLWWEIKLISCRLHKTAAPGLWQHTVREGRRTIELDPECSAGSQQPLSYYASINIDHLYFKNKWWFYITSSKVTGKEIEKMDPKWNFGYLPVILTF